MALNDIVMKLARSKGVRLLVAGAIAGSMLVGCNNGSSSSIPVQSTKYTPQQIAAMEQEITGLVNSKTLEGKVKYRSLGDRTLAEFVLNGVTYSLETSRSADLSRFSIRSSDKTNRIQLIATYDDGSYDEDNTGPLDGIVDVGGTEGYDANGRPLNTNYNRYIPGGNTISRNALQALHDKNVETVLEFYRQK